jgi:heterodisulfide reductase subunit A
MSVNEERRIGVFICHCGINIGGIVNVPEVVEYAKTLPYVAYAEDNLYTCSSEGLEKIKDAIHRYNLNRVVVASCTPRTHEPLFRAACEEAGLNKYLFHMANIREQCSWVHMHELEKATEKAKDIIQMAVAKAALLEPQTEPEIEVAPTALIIGGGIAGMAASINLANQGFTVHLVEKEPELGGLLIRLHKLYPGEKSAKQTLEDHVKLVEANKNINVYTSSMVKEVSGFIGNFKVKIDHAGTEKQLDVGTIIVAVGAEPFEPHGFYGYREYENVVTQVQLEQLLKEERLPKVQRLVMIQCVGAKTTKGLGVPYCSRICCATALKNALVIRELCPETEICIIYRDMQAYGREFEEYYRKCREKFIQFLRYDSERPPEASPRLDGKLRIRVFDTLLNSIVEFDTDLLVLSVPLVPPKEAKELSQMLKVPLDANGFFLEAHVKLRPVDFATDGIFLCGTAHSPKTVAESMVQAYAAASRAAIPMALKKVRTEAITAYVDEALCTGCGTCIKLCPYSAVQKDENGVARVNEVLCKGCGLCAASCPEKAIDMKHFSDAQVLAEATAVLGGT